MLVKWQSLLQDYAMPDPNLLYELQGDSFKSSACLPTLGVYVAKHDPYLKKEHYFSQTFASCIHFGVSIILLFWGYSGCVFLLAIIGIWSNVVSSDSLHFPRRSGIVEPVCLSCRRKLQGYIIPWELIWGKWGELPPLPPKKLKTCSL